MGHCRRMLGAGLPTMSPNAVPKGRATGPTQRSCSTIPIVFAVAVDPIEVGLVASLSRPGGNMTGVTNMNVDIGSKRLELLHEVLPKATNFGVLIDPTSAAVSKDFVRVLQSAAHTLGVKLYVRHASTEHEIDTVFASLSEQRAEGLVVGPSTFFTGRTEQLAALGLRHALPTIYQYRPFAAAGGFVSYGSDEAEYTVPVKIYRKEGCGDPSLGNSRSS